MDIALDDILLPSPHNHAANSGVIGLGPEIVRVSGIATVFKRDQMILFVAGHVIGMRHATGPVDSPGVWIDQFSPCLMHGIPILPKLFAFQFARIARWRPD